jgi:hypothetical protein
MNYENLNIKPSRAHANLGMMNLRVFLHSAAHMPAHP